jgi:hypothetical protein
MGEDNDGLKVKIRLMDEKDGAGKKVREMVISMLEALEVMAPTVDEALSALITTLALVLSKSDLPLTEIGEGLSDMMGVVLEIVENERKNEIKKNNKTPIYVAVKAGEGCERVEGN